MLQNIFFGLSLGAVYSLIAVGFALVRLVKAGIEPQEGSTGGSYGGSTGTGSGSTGSGGTGASYAGTGTMSQTGSTGSSGQSGSTGQASASDISISGNV